MTDIPKQKHDDAELNELRMRNAFATRPPLQHIKSQALNPVILIIAYLTCLTAVGLAIGKIFIPALVCASLVLLFSLFIFWKKPRSHHHATIMAIITLLVLVFGSVYYLKQFEQTNYDAQGSTRY